MFSKSVVNHTQTPCGMYIGNGRALVKTKWGDKLLVDAEDMLIAPHLLLDGEWEVLETKWFREVIKPGMVFVDVGANIGYYTVMAARMGAAEVHAFEPNPATFQLLRDNVSLNWVRERVHCEQAAVSDSVGASRMQMRKRYAGNSSFGATGAALLEELGDTAEYVEVTTVTLDGYAESRGVQRMDVVKVDAEGWEPAVFRGMVRLLREGMVRQMLCEWSPVQLADARQSPDAMLAQWREAGFRVQWVEKDLQEISLEKVSSLPHANLVLRR